MGRSRWQFSLGHGPAPSSNDANVVSWLPDRINFIVGSAKIRFQINGLDNALLLFPTVGLTCFWKWKWWGSLIDIRAWGDRWLWLLILTWGGVESWRLLASPPWNLCLIASDRIARNIIVSSNFKIFQCIF